MVKFSIGCDLSHKLITEVRTSVGYLQVLEYTLPDLSLLHIVSWHFNDVVMEFDGNTVPKYNSTTFYRDKLSALSFAEEIGCKLLKGM